MSTYLFVAATLPSHISSSSAIGSLDNTNGPVISPKLVSTDPEAGSIASTPAIEILVSVYPLLDASLSVFAASMPCTVCMATLAEFSSSELEISIRLPNGDLVEPNCALNGPPKFGDGSPEISAKRLFKTIRFSS